MPKKISAKGEKTKKYFLYAIVIATVCVFFPTVSKAETLKIGFVTDWEYGKQKEYDHKLPNKAKKYLKEAVNHYNNVFHPDIVIGGGDYILGRHVSSKKAKKQLKEIDKVFRLVAAPRRYCIGNHDLSHLSKVGVQNSLSMAENHSVTDMEGIRIITLDTNDLAEGKDKYGVNGRVSEEELAWLDEQLKAGLPTVIFSHHSPILTQDKNSMRVNIIDADEVRTVIEKYDNVVAMFSGHHAVNYSLETNGVRYVIINNLTDRNAKGSFADITIQKNDSEDEITILVSQYGKKPASYNITKQIL